MAAINTKNIFFIACFPLLKVCESDLSLEHTATNVRLRLPKIRCVLLNGSAHCKGLAGIVTVDTLTSRERNQFVTFWRRHADNQLASEVAFNGLDSNDGNSQLDTLTNCAHVPSVRLSAARGVPCNSLSGETQVSVVSLRRTG
jgi:hypothetical protein